MVPGLLSTVLPWLPLDEATSKRTKGKPASQAKHKIQAKPWSLVESLQQMGELAHLTVPYHHTASSCAARSTEIVSDKLLVAWLCLACHQA